MNFIKLSDYLSKDFNIDTALWWLGFALLGACWLITGSFWLGIIGMLISFYPAGLVLALGIPIIALLLQIIGSSLCWLRSQP